MGAPGPVSINRFAVLLQRDRRCPTPDPLVVGNVLKGQM